MDIPYTPPQLWEAEKNLLLYLEDVSYYANLIKNDLDDYDQEDIEILAYDIDNSLLSYSDRLYRGLQDLEEHITVEQISQYMSSLHDHIITNSETHFATDLVESEPMFTTVQDFLVQQSRKMKKTMLSIDIIEVIKYYTLDLIAWAEIWYIHNGRDIHEELASRSNTILKVLNRDPDLEDGTMYTKDGADSTKAFRNYFIKDYDAYKIAKINGRFNDLGKQKKDGYISKIAALTALLFDRKVLSKTYKDTLTYLFKRLSIKDDPTAYKPAQFKRPSMKGTMPASWEEANQFYDSL